MSKFLLMRVRPIVFGVALSVFSAGVWISCGESVDKPAELVALEERLPQKVDYNLHIKPILSDRCFACHGPDKANQKGGLRLDTPEGAYEVLSESGNSALVAGSLAKSEVYHRIVSTDPDYQMPTPGSNLSLTAEEKALIIRWIEQGAEYKPHWSLLAPRSVDPPKVEREDWVRNDIDRFVLKKLEEKGLSPNPEADKMTLLRRVSLDLTGLPPTVEEIDAFMADKRPDAYEKVVDRLLASPHYGERQAMEWLDVARYADTHGYQDDGLRTMWPYRDWVIRAFNQNMPYDRFITWQLAGDLLPVSGKNGRPENRSQVRERLIATAFNRNHQQSQESGIVDEEYRTEYVADRVNTFGKAMLGLTVECARCHDHKYDPISQKDYFALYAFFNNNNERGQIPYSGEPSPSLPLTTPEQEARLKGIRARLDSLEPRLRLTSPVYRPAFALWLQKVGQKPVSLPQVGLIGHYSFDETDPAALKDVARLEAIRKREADRKKKLAAEKGLKPEVPVPVRKTPENLAADPRNVCWNKVNDTLPARLGGDSESLPYRVPGRIGGARFLPGDSDIEFPQGFAVFERHQPFTIASWFQVSKPGLEGLLLGRTDGAPEGNRGYELTLLKDGRLKFTMNYVWPDNSLDIESVAKIPYQQWVHVTMTYDGSGGAGGLALYIDGERAASRIITDNLYQSISQFKAGYARGRVPFLIGRCYNAYTKDFAVDELRIYNRSLTPLEIPRLAEKPDALLQALRTPAAARTSRQQAGLYAYYLSAHDPHYRQVLAAATDYRARETDIYTNAPQVMVMKERSYPRKTYLLKRGAYDAPAEEVAAATPAKLLAFPAGYPKNRLGLTRWLLHPENSLFSRVAVNRFWQQYFGQGLVKSSDDFGNQGDLPSHPELLDYLAVRFRDGGSPVAGPPAGRWNTLAMHRMIVLSATYRQSSRADASKREADPDNTWLSRGPSYRLPAEQIRDNVLTASRLLVRKLGGPSVHPYQPAGIWEALATRNAVHYVQNHGDSLYRRSMYTIWKRSSPPPMMLNFDASERHFCIVRRQKTSTPLQALVTLNDPQFIEAARVLVQRAKARNLKSDELIDYAFKSLVSRPARSTEVKLMNQLYREELTDFRENPRSAAELLSVGEFPVEKQIPAPELAAWTVVISTIMNVDEAIIKR